MFGIKVEAKVEICTGKKECELDVVYKYKSKWVCHGNGIKVHVGWTMGASCHEQESASSFDYMRCKKSIYPGIAMELMSMY